MENEEAETAPVTFRVSNARPVHARDLFALVDVEVLVGGVAFDIFGIQARRESGEKTSIRLPTFKDADGSWQPALRLPDETRGPLADAVLTFLMEEGLAKRRFEPPCEVLSWPWFFGQGDKLVPLE